MRSLYRALLKAVIITATAAMASASLAGPILSQATFQASITDAVVDDYSNPGYSLLQGNIAMSGVLGETRYSSTGFANLNLVPNFAGNAFYCAGCNSSFSLDFTDTSIGNASGVFAVGFNFFNRSNPPFVASVLFGDGSSNDFVLAAGGATSDFSRFFGITSAEGISAIHLGLANAASTVSGDFGIDNLTIGCDPAQQQRCFVPGTDPAVPTSTDIPLPTTPALLLLGLGALSLTRRRRQAADAN